MEGQPHQSPYRDRTTAPQHDQAAGALRPIAFRKILCLEELRPRSEVKVHMQLLKEGCPGASAHALLSLVSKGHSKCPTAWSQDKLLTPLYQG